MNRPAVGGFVALAIATIAAFFVVQHLKVTTPLINGYPAPAPAAINPVSGGTCTVPGPHGVPVRLSFRDMKVSFYLQNRADSVDVYIQNAAGDRVRQIGSGVYMPVKHRHTFRWDGRLADGTVAPDGRYTIQVALIHQGRSFLISNQNSGTVEPVTVQTHFTRPRVTAVTPNAVAAGQQVTIHYTGADGLRPEILVYRIRSTGALRQVKHYAATSRGGTSVWDTTLAGGRPARPGRYLVAVQVVTRTCNTLRSPVSIAAAPQAIVTVS